MNSLIQIKEIVEHRLSSIALVDCGYLQGRDAVLKQLNARSHQSEDTKVDLFIKNAQNSIEKIIQISRPHNLPEDYLFFLKYYGGLIIENDNLYFQILGVGPMVEEWYSSVDSEITVSNPGESGLISIGSLSFRSGKYKYLRVDFLLDLIGHHQKYGIIGIGPWGKEDSTFNDVISDFPASSNMWSVVADSFIMWLDIAAQTQGFFSYK